MTELNTRCETDDELYELNTRCETDDELYERIAEAYGKWGAFLGHAMECRGTALDECAAHVGLKRLGNVRVG